MNTHKTAITRTKLSTPAKYLNDNKLLNGLCLDFGCGKGFDCDELGIDGYDPYYRNVSVPFDYYKTIMCNFVLNVLQEREWDIVLSSIRKCLCPGGIAYISVRNDKRALKGFTTRGTYQTFVELDLPIVKKTSSFIMYKMEK